MNYVFFLPDGPTLGGVEGWSYSMVRLLNQKSPGSAHIISLVEWSQKEKSRSYPGDIQGAYTELIVDHRKMVEERYFSSLIDQIRPYFKDSTYVFPNYGSHSYALAVAMKNILNGRCSLICTLHADDFHNYCLARYFSPYVDSYIAVSSKIAEHLKASMPWRALDVRTRACGVENISEKPVAQTKFQDLAVKTRFCYVGRLSVYQKRILDLLKAVEIFEKHKFHCQFDIVGDGPDRQKLQESLDKMKLEHVQVQFHGKRSRQEVISILDRSHVFCSFSEFEGTSISLMEALGRGCLPLVTDVSGVRDLIDSEKFIFTMGKLEDFYNKAVQLSAMSSEEALRSGLAFREKVLKNSLDLYFAWFLGEFSSQNFAALVYRPSELFRNWDYTWNPAIFQKENSHPLFRMYEKVKAKWYGRYLISIIQRGAILLAKK